MNIKFEEGNEEPNPLWVLQQISEEAFRVAGEALRDVYAGNSSFPPLGPGHRRTRSEVVTTGPRRNSSFHRMKTQMQKAWRWGSNSTDESCRSSFNPEVLANQKRQWYQLHSKALVYSKSFEEFIQVVSKLPLQCSFLPDSGQKLQRQRAPAAEKQPDHTKYKEPTSLFEHFVVAGLHPVSNLEPVESAFAKRKKWEMEMAKSNIVDFKLLQHRGPSYPTLEPQILFKYPTGKKLAMRSKDLAAFCFPDGVQARLLERTPSLSDLNELVYGQEHLGRDDHSFVFSLKVADNATLYGVCLHVSEIVQRPPAILGSTSPLRNSSEGCSRFLVSAPRCYCVLTRVPFFPLHYELLNSIIAQERLNRITQFVSEMSLTDYVSSTSKINDQMHVNDESPERECTFDWTVSAIPVDNAIALTAAAAGIIPDDEIPQSPPKAWEPNSPESLVASETSDVGQSRDFDKDGRKSLQYPDDFACKTLESRTDNMENLHGNQENGHASPEVCTSFSSRVRTLECRGSSESLFSPARSIASEDDDDGSFSNCEKDFGDDLIMEWAKENRNDLLQIVCGYHSLSLPSHGSELIFQPLEHLQPILYKRFPVSDLGSYEEYLDSPKAAEVKAKLASAEEALALSIWTTATVCRVLSLESLLALVAGVLLEKQVVVVCPNLGVLSATVLFLIPMILPFQWQSLMLPVLPMRMLDFLDAPVPFIVGLQNKPSDLKIKASNLILVNVPNDQVKLCHVPTLPRHKELVSELTPIHAKLAREGSIARKHPVYRCNEYQAEAGGQFLKVMQNYMESLCGDLRSNSITSVQSNNDRVSLLLKESFIDSFPSKDQAFIKLFVDTQMFSVLSDSRLSSFENES